jgi:anti-anti-sigma factor
MDLILEVRTGRERVTMACHGKLIGGKEAEAFRRSAMLLIGGFDAVTINLAGVRLLDCGGLGALASVLELARERGKQVSIARASKLVREMLEMMQLDRFLEQAAEPPRLIARQSSAAVA